MRAEKAGNGKMPVVDIIKALSCIMIFLFHCNTILPGEWKFLTLFGQDLGNNLFFMVSGFSLAPSIDHTSVKKFHFWYLKRLVRIIPITAIAYAAAYLRGYYSFDNPAMVFAVFVYPTLYWFITAILVFYIILFFLSKCIRQKSAGIIMILLFIIFLRLGDRQERLYVIGFFAMLCGYYLRGIMIKGHPLTENSKAHRVNMAVLLLLCFVSFLAGELTDMAVISRILIFAGAMGTGLCSLMLGLYFNEPLTDFFDNKKRLHSFIRYLGDMALPLYLVQCFCSGYIGFWIGLHIDFPLSFPVNFIVVWTAGSLLYFLEIMVIRCYNKMLLKAEYGVESEKKKCL